MSDPCRRIAVVFDLDRADYATREIVRGIHQYAHEQAGRWVPTLDPLAKEHLDGRYDGVVAPGDRVLARRAAAAGVPFVAATCRNIIKVMPRVVADRRGAGRLAARHLVAHGYTHLGFVGLDWRKSSTLLEQGFQSGLRPRGYGAHVLLVGGKLHQSGSRWRDRHLACFAEWLDGLPKPVGILAAEDALARHLADLSAERGLRVPDDVGIVAAGDDPAVCLAPPVPLTAIDFRFEAVGRRAARYLDRLMDGRPRWRGNVYVEPGLVARASTAREFFHDDAVAEAVLHVQERCHRRLTVAEVAAAVGLGERQLLRRFRHSRHHTVAREILLARLARAKDLMRTTRLPLDAVARGSGFRNARHLARAFRRVEHCAPGAWRREAGTRPARDVHPLEHAKQLLEETECELDVIAMICGFGTLRRLRYAFCEQEGMLPSRWRRRYRKPPRPSRKPVGPRVVIRFIGPGGELDDERTYPPAGEEGRGSGVEGRGSEAALPAPDEPPASSNEHRAPSIQHRAPSTQHPAPKPQAAPRPPARRGRVPAPAGVILGPGKW